MYTWDMSAVFRYGIVRVTTVDIVETPITVFAPNPFLEWVSSTDTAIQKKPNVHAGFIWSWHSKMMQKKNNINPFILSYTVYSLDSLTHKWKGNSGPSNLVYISKRRILQTQWTLSKETPLVTAPAVCLRQVPTLMRIQLERNNWSLVGTSETAFPALGRCMSYSVVRFERIDCWLNKIMDSLVLN